MPRAFKFTLLAVAAFAAGLLSGAAQAALQGRDLNGSAGSFEAYYDTDLDITWLADANYAKTSGYDSNGKLSWDEAATWAADLSFTDGVRVYDNWRLPTAVSAEHGSLSEMAYMFQANLSNPEYAGSFVNLQSDAYWAAAEVAQTGKYRWSFDMGTELLDETKLTKGLYAWAVSPGDIGVVSASVPEAHMWAMLLAGLGLVAVAVKRRPIV